MRKWIDLLETPIADVQVQGDPWENTDFSQGQSFGDADKKVLTSRKGIEKIVRAFKRTPFMFEVFFMNTIQVDGNSASDNNKVDDHAAHFNAGIHNEWGGISGKPGVIRVILISNLSPLEGKMPMNAWTLAHKIGHSLQDGMINAGWDPLVRNINEVMADIVGAETGIHGGYAGSSSFYGQPQFMHLMTMKSARNNTLQNPFEVFAEIVAQYLITGQVTLNVGQPQAQRLTAKLNRMLKMLFKQLEGKVLLEV